MYKFPEEQILILLRVELETEDNTIATDIAN